MEQSTTCRQLGQPTSQTTQRNLPRSEEEAGHGVTLITWKLEFRYDLNIQLHGAVQDALRYGLRLPTRISSLTWRSNSQAWTPLKLASSYASMLEPLTLMSLCGLTCEVAQTGCPLSLPCSRISGITCQYHHG